MPAAEYSGDIAIIGMSGAFPGARTLDEFYDALCEGREMVRFLTPEEQSAGSKDAAEHDAYFVPAVAAMDDVDLFDATFFGMTAQEAELTDPQHRILLEHSWRAMEHAGYDPHRFAGAVGVFGGATINTYLIRNIAGNPRVMASADPLQLNIANGGDFLITRISYKLNLKGPSHTVQSACSTSLVAVHAGCRSLLDMECDMALAGGVSVNVNFLRGYRYQDGGIMSPDGHCRVFDAKARGTIFSSGVGVVVLKRLEDALGDGDTIHAVIKGSAINNDGSLKAGYTAPSVEGQAEVIAEAIANAGVDPESISYVECHGTGTLLGDPVEVRALSKVFNAATARHRFCALGSVKSNLGHLDAAAGVTGLIKVVLSLKHGLLPPSLHFEQPNPQIDFSQGPFYINTELREWKSEAGLPRRAGVSAFGVGGTNAHVVVEEAPAQTRTETAGEKRRQWQLLTLSARTETALAKARKNLAEHLEREPEVDLGDVAYTLQVGRRPFALRWSGVCETREDAILQLQAGLLEKNESGSSSGQAGEEGEKRVGERGSEVAALTGMGQMWEKGMEIDWGALHAGEKRHRVPLPTYPFERKRYWIEPASAPLVVEEQAMVIATETVASGQNESVYSPRPLLRNSYVSPQNEAEQKAVAILERALGIRPVGVTDQYGELGGDSLTAVRVIDQLNIAFHSSLRVVDLYEGLTVRDLVRLVSSEPSAPSEATDNFAKTDRRQMYRQSRRLLHQSESA